CSMEHMTQLQKTFFKRWEGEDPWTYREEETTDVEMEAREKTMRRLIMESERYEDFRAKILEPSLKAVRGSLDGYLLKDYDIERMLAEEKDRGVIRRLVSRDIIPDDRADKYRLLMKSPDWKTIKSNWNKLQRTVEKSFNTETKMRVFAYNDKMETDTVMTPLDSIKYHRMFLQLGSISVDPKTGHVKSWVGGINHKYFQFDHVRTNRQVGSTFKPFVYATAIAQQGISPCFEVDDIPYTIHQGEGNFNLLEDWTPTNANDRYSGERFTLRRGLQFSKNTVSVYLMKQLGDAEPVRDLVQQMGIPKTKVPPAPSICLGATDLSVFEMAGAYTTFANNGIYSRPIFIARIVDNNGREIYVAEPEEHQALHPNPNYVMLDMLKSTVTQLGGRKGFGGLKSEIGGKTGTTNDYVDGWFMGITPDLVVGTWVGGEDRWVRFRDIRYGIGATMARPFFAKLMQKLENTEGVDYDNSLRFVRPPGDIGIVMNCAEYISPLGEGEEGEFMDGEDPNAFGDEDPFGGEDAFGGEDSFGEPVDTSGVIQ
ncbi:MAG: transglycosylase domain-containing protein, partial [Bacteroidota bacterium]